MVIYSPLQKYWTARPSLLFLLYIEVICGWDQNININEKNILYNIMKILIYRLIVIFWPQPYMSLVYSERHTLSHIYYSNSYENVHTVLCKYSSKLDYNTFTIGLTVISNLKWPCNIIYDNNSNHQINR